VLISICTLSEQSRVLKQILQRGQYAVLHSSLNCPFRIFETFAQFFFSAYESSTVPTPDEALGHDGKQTKNKQTNEASGLKSTKE
jgi:hypothetical protein